MIDQQLAEAWGRITEKAVEIRPWVSGPTWCYDDGLWRRVPDPAENPWAWLTKFDGNWWEDIMPPLHRFLVQRGDTSGNGRGDTPEAALEAAIRDWAAKVDALEAVDG